MPETMVERSPFVPDLPVESRWPERACCCAAPPVVKVLLPLTASRDHRVDLFLCGHHYRASFGELALSGATTCFRDEALALW